METTNNNHNIMKRQTQATRQKYQTGSESQCCWNFSTNITKPAITTTTINRITTTTTNAATITITSWVLENPWSE